MIRSAKIEDAEKIAAIHVSAWQSAYKGILPAHVLVSLSVEERVHMWRDVISEQHGTVLLAIAPQGEVGWISFGPSRDEDGREKPEIYAIYVLPQFWHHAVGRGLLDEAERRLLGHRFIASTLWVLEKNSRARLFYEARGYQLDMIRKETRIGESLFTELRYEKTLANCGSSRDSFKL
jgi:GNAT superfamily N-acetyltransferase